MQEHLSHQPKLTHNMAGRQVISVSPDLQPSWVHKRISHVMQLPQFQIQAALHADLHIQIKANIWLWQSKTKQYSPLWWWEARAVQNWWTVLLTGCFDMYQKSWPCRFLIYWKLMNCVWLPGRWRLSPVICITNIYFYYVMPLEHALLWHWLLASSRRSAGISRRSFK